MTRVAIEAAAVLVTAVLFAGSAAASDRTDVVATIHRFADGFNRGDVDATVGGCDDETSIIDNFPPHEWHGAGACRTWMADLETFSSRIGITQGVVAMKKPRHVDVTDVSRVRRDANDVPLPDEGRAGRRERAVHGRIAKGRAMEDHETGLLGAMP